jgi:hypothetical protein
VPQRHDQRLMSGRAQEFHQVGAGEAGGLGVDERMKVEPFLAHHRLVQDHADPASLIVDRAEGRHRAGQNPPCVLQKLSRAEGDASLGADFLVHAPEIDCGFFAQDKQEQPALLILEKQIFRMPAGDFSAQRLGLLDVWSGGCSTVWVSIPSVAR